MDVDDSGAVGAIIIKVMRSRVCGLLCISAATCLVVSGQTPDWFGSVHADINDLRYPPLARMARIVGTVAIKIDPLANGKVETTVFGGHPLLRPVALANLEKWHFDPSLSRPITIEYVFRLTPSDTITKSVPRGEALDRFFLRLFLRAEYRDEIECHANLESVKEGPIRLDSWTLRINIATQQVCDVNCVLYTKTAD